MLFRIVSPLIFNIKSILVIGKSPKFLKYTVGLNVSSQVFSLKLGILRESRLIS